MLEGENDPRKDEKSLEPRVFSRRFVSFRGSFSLLSPLGQ
jgi:hypothetical protein